MTKGFIVRALGLVFVASVGFVALAGHRRPAIVEPDQKLLRVETLTISPVSSFQQRRTFTGIIKAARSSELGFERTGRLVVVDVEEGDRVAAGQVLAQLDTRNLEARHRELTAQRSAAQASLDELISGPRKQTIAEAAAEVSDLEAQHNLAELQYQRSEALLRDNAISRDDYEQTTFGKKSLEARLDAARHRLDELEAGTRPEQIDARKAVVAQLDAAIENVKVDLNESKLTAPFAGTISQRYADEGTIVEPGTPLLRVVEDSHLEAWIGLPPATVTRLTPDAELKVQVRGQSYNATLSRVLPELDKSTRTQTAIFELTGTDGRVVPAQVARVDINESNETGGFWLPTTALTRGSRGLWSVLVAETDDGGDNHVAARRDIELLHTDGERVLVRGTLRPGDCVIASGTHRLVAGQAVDIGDQQPAKAQALKAVRESSAVGPAPSRTRQVHRALAGRSKS